MMIDETTYGIEPQARASQQFKEVVDILVRRRWLIIVVFLVVSGATAAYTFTRPVEYEASSVVMVNLGRPMSASSGSAQSAAAGTGENVFATNERTLAGELFVIQNSRTIAQRVTERLRSQQESRVDTASGVLQENDEEAPVRSHVVFTPASRDVNAINITAISTSPREATRLAKLYAEEYVRLTQDASRTHMKASRQFLQEQVDQRRGELLSAEEQIKTYLQVEGAVGLDGAASGLVGQIASLEAQRDNAQVELEMLERNQAEMERQLSELSPQIVVRYSSDIEPSIKATQAKLAELEIAKREILLRHPGLRESEIQHPDLPRLNVQIAELSADLRELSQAYVDQVESAGGLVAPEAGLARISELRQNMADGRIQMNNLRAQIDVLATRLEEYEGQLSTIPERSLGLARLERTRAHAEQMYQFVLQSLQEARIAEESEPGYAHILSIPFVPTEPVRPDRQKNLLLGLFFGVLLGFGGAFVRDRLDNRIFDPDQLRQEGTQLLGVVPDCGPMIKKYHKGREVVRCGDQDFSSTMSVLIDPWSTVAESYRHIRTRIQFSLPDRVVQTILVTSPGMGDGKSTTAANLAAVMVQAGRKTLLIDADLRKPRLHTFFSEEQAPGLADVLRFESGAVPNIERKISDNLYLLSAGSLRATDAKSRRSGDGYMTNPAELIGSQALRELIREKRGQYDVIVVDSPPVLAASDAALLSTQCDATILVVRAGATKERELSDSLETLDDVGAAVIGVLLNGLDVVNVYSQRHNYRYNSAYGIYGTEDYVAYGANLPRRASKALWRSRRSSL